LERRRMHTEFWKEMQKESDHKGDIDIDGKLKY
jgi:hypothetical protein